MNLLQLPFDQYGRYRMVREVVDAAASALGHERLRVLDVGGYFEDYSGTPRLPAPAFLERHDVTVLDRPDVQLPHYVRGDGNELQFDDSSFDLVISCDTLEHIPAEDRARFVGQLLRVARHGVLLICPMADGRVVLAEQILSAYVRAEFNLEQPQLAEHSAYGLPEAERVRALFAEAGCQTRDYPSGYIFAWLPMMLAKHYLGAQGDDVALKTGLDELYNLSYAANDRREPSYRRLVLAARDNTGNWLEAADDVLAPTIRPPDEATGADWLGLTNQLLGLLQLRLGERAEQRRQAFLRSENEFLRGANEFLRGENSHLRDHIGSLDRAMADQAQHIHKLIAHGEEMAARAKMFQEAAQWREGQIADLEQRARWLEQQAEAARRELAAMQNGTVMRLLGRVRGR